MNTPCQIFVYAKYFEIRNELALLRCFFPHPYWITQTGQVGYQLALADKCLLHTKTFSTNLIASSNYLITKLNLWSLVKDQKRNGAYAILPPIQYPMFEQIHNSTPQVPLKQTTVPIRMGLVRVTGRTGSTEQTSRYSEPNWKVVVVVYVGIGSSVAFGTCSHAASNAVVVHAWKCADMLWWCE